MKRLTRLVLPDVHIPFADENLLGSWMESISIFKPDGIDIIGDLMDCYTLSRFDKNPARKVNLQEEITDTRRFLGNVRCLAGRGCDIRYSEGNHEDRMRKMLWRKVPELADLQNLTIPELLGLKKLVGLKKLDYGPALLPVRLGLDIVQFLGVTQMPNLIGVLDPTPCCTGRPTHPV